MRSSDATAKRPRHELERARDLYRWIVPGPTLSASRQVES